MSLFSGIYGHGYNAAGIGGALQLTGSGLRIITPLTLGTSFGVSLDAGNDCLKVSVAGVYRFIYSVSVDDHTSSNNGFHTILCKNDSSVNQIAGSDGRGYAPTQSRAITLCGMCFVSLATADTVGVYIENTTTIGHDIYVENVSITCTRVA